MGIETCGIFHSATELLPRLADLTPTLALIDVALPGINGIELVGEIKRRRPELPCLMLSGHAEAMYVQRALAAGADGYVAKGNPFELAAAIEEILAGRRYVSLAIRGSLPEGDDAPAAAPDE